MTLPAAAAARLFALDTLVDTVVKAIDEKAYTSETKNGQSQLTVTDEDFVYTVYYDTSSGRISGAEVTEGEDRITYTFIQ